MKIGFSPKLGVGFNLLGMNIFDRYRIIFDNRAKKDIKGFQNLTIIPKEA